MYICINVHVRNSRIRIAICKPKLPSLLGKIEVWLANFSQKLLFILLSPHVELRKFQSISNFLSTSSFLYASFF